MPNDLSAGGAIINLLQITDCHLTKDPGGDLLGVKTRESLDAVLSLIKQNLSEHAHGYPDHILATGDLAQDASPEAYLHFKEKMQEFDCPSSWFPGNHDDPTVMSKVINSGNELEPLVRKGAWQIILLDSSVRGAVHGCIEQQDLDMLDAALCERPELHSLVCLHHHPVNIGSEWLDNIGVHNNAALFEILDKHENVRALLWGHIHQELNEEREGVKLFSTPSTCIQFLPKSAGFAVESIAPGYRWMRLFPDGQIETSVVRAENYAFDLDLDSAGY